MKEEHKTSKALKGQLLGAISMMLVAAIALGTSTYAWFINNNVVEVENMQLTVSTSTSMLVAVGIKGGNTYTEYKSVITNPDIIGTAENQGKWTAMLTNPMTPASTTDLTLKTGAPAFFETNNHVSNGKLDEFAAVTTENVGEGTVKKIPLRFFADSDMKVYFGKDALTSIADLITAASGDTSNGANAAAIKRALRVAVVAKADGNTAGTNNAVVSTVFQFDKPTAGATGNNTDYKYVTSFGDTGATDIAGIPAKQLEADGKYPAIATVDGSKHVTGVNLLSALVPDHTTAATDANKKLATVNTSGSSPVVSVTDQTELFGLTAAKPRDVDIYIWLEGTDNECLNTLSKMPFNLMLPFAGIITTAP